ncbi:MAG: coenzyme F420-0:L-glutamate ligase [bacterium]|nr:coenzyme F420-0:L-glutamate ligase [bacterium]
MQIKPLKTKIFREHEELVPFILKYVKKLPEKSVLVITSKIAALAEGRTKEFKSEKQKEDLIKQESNFAVKTSLVWMTIKDGQVLASAGIDESNGDGRMILLPKNSFQTASDIRQVLRKKYKIKNLGILITDSKLSPLRRGVVGTALGYAGFRGLRDYRGAKDLFGRTLKFSSTNVADSLATAAVLTMGEGRESQPLAVITGAPLEFTEKINKAELRIKPTEDMFYPIFKNLNVKNKKKL